jgi:transcriptional repressor NrdR
MRCPFCKEDDDKVIDSRASSDGFAIRRRRECLGCSRRFTTYERIEESPLRVIKKDGVREPFERRKILLGLIKACEKRPIAIADLEAITERIESRVLEEYDSEVPVSYIGELVMQELKDVDQVAYVRFASVYREFKDINEFMDELKGMLSGGRVSLKKVSLKKVSLKKVSLKKGSAKRVAGKKAAGKKAATKMAAGKSAAGTSSAATPASKPSSKDGPPQDSASKSSTPKGTKRR